MSIKKPRGISEGSRTRFRRSIQLILALSVVTIPVCNSTSSRTEPVPEWELNDEAEEREKKPDNYLKKKDIEIDHIDDPFDTRYA